MEAIISSVRQLDFNLVTPVIDRLIDKFLRIRCEYENLIRSDHPILKTKFYKRCICFIRGKNFICEHCAHVSCPSHRENCINCKISYCDHCSDDLNICKKCCNDTCESCSVMIGEDDVLCIGCLPRSVIGKNCLDRFKVEVCYQLEDLDDVVYHYKQKIW